MGKSIRAQVAVPSELDAALARLYGRPEEERVKIGLAYTTRHFQLSTDPFDGDLASSRNERALWAHAQSLLPVRSPQEARKAPRKRGRPKKG